MDAEEGLGVEALLEAGEGGADEEGLGADVEIDVFAGGLEPAHIVDAEDVEALALLDDDAFEVLTALARARSRARAKRSGSTGLRT